MGQQARVLFDHEQDARPRRTVADWGGDEVFARTPRKRFKPVVIGSDDLHAAPRAHVAEPVRPRLQVVPEPADVVEVPVVQAPVPVVEDPHRPDEVGPNGRRTVVITGRPGAAAAPSTSRRRPPRTVEERVGARPDRVAAWACGLGVTLILTAVATADAATRAL